MAAKIGDYHNGLRKAKSQYCSVPGPRWFKDYIETRAWWVCKAHDNSVGIKGKGKISLARAHYNFLLGILTKSHLPYLLRPVFVLIAIPVIFVRGRGELGKVGGKQE